MAWQYPYVKTLRILIDDLTDDPDYTDSRLEDILVVAVTQVQRDVTLDSSYTVTISPPSITPDPEEDHELMTLATLKAACIIDRGSLRLAAAVNGINAKCGPVSMTVNGRMGGFATLIDKGYCQAYEEAVKQYRFGNSKFIRAIMSPFINEDFDPHDYTR